MPEKKNGSELMSKILDMTEGHPLRLLAKFSVPLLLTNILQLLYTIVDSMVVGRLLGVNAFASVGASLSLYWLVFYAILGFTQGFSVLFAQRFGAKDFCGMRKAFAMAIILSTVIGAVFGCTGILLCKPVLLLINTPVDILDDAIVYLRFLFGGIIITFAYNLAGSMLRALGDAKTPLHAMVFSTLLNLALDILLVAFIPLGVAGVAIATVIAQFVACGFCVIQLYNTQTARMTRQDFRWDTGTAKELLRLGAPHGFSSCFIEVGGLVVQYAINEYGTNFIAGIAAAKRFYSLLLVYGGAVEASIATFVAQNYGAKLYSRVKHGVTVARRMMLISAFVIMVFVLVFGRTLLGLLIAGEQGQIDAVLDIGQRQLAVMTLGMPVLCMLFLYRSSLQGIGNSLMPMLSGFLELFMRIASVLLLPFMLGIWGVYLADAIGWIAAALQLFIAYIMVFKRKCLENME